jgi:replication factor C subunit 2/4
MDDSLPWIEKYRPRKLNDVVIGDHIKYKLSRIVDNKIMPNIIITGSYGTGKTSTIQCIKRELLGKYTRSNSLELNASDDRGVKSVYEHISTFCKKKMDIPDCEKDMYSKYKIVILDEADNITPKAQKLINILMDKYEKSVRFAFTCNNSAEIIESIQSKCLIIKYSKHTEEYIYDRLAFICNNENLKYKPSALKMVIKICEYDIRQSVNFIQTLHTQNKSIYIENIKNASDGAFNHINDIIYACLNKNLQQALSTLKKMRDSGYFISDIMSNMLYTLRNMNTNNPHIIEYITIVGMSYAIISYNNETDLQLVACIIDMSMIHA